MKFQLFFTICMAVLFLFFNTAEAQVISKPDVYYDSDISMNFSPDRFSNLNSSVQSNDKFKEFLAFELGYLGGGALTAGLFFSGFVIAWNGSEAGAILIIGSIVSALATPAIAGTIMHRVGRKYHPGGTIFSSILGSYIGVAAGLMVGSMIQYGASTIGAGGLVSGLATATMLFIPGIVATSFYNMFPRNNQGGQALMNINNGNFKIASPSMSIAQNPFIPGKNIAMFKLMSATF